MIAVIDYGAGNLQSVVKAFHHIGCDTVVTKDERTLLECDGAILPGVGSFGDAMDCMDRSLMRGAVLQYVKTGKPLLGICLGLQLLFPGSGESPEAKGLSLLEGTISKIPNVDGTLKIPHIGWNSLEIKNHGGIYKGITGEPYVYFVHSYYLHAKDRAIVSAQTQYATAIDASVSYQNITATQFHPEKSGDAGLLMLKNFADMTLADARERG